jgi:type III restriction enzyme
MPTLDWLDRAQAITAADRVPYRILEPVSSHGDGDAENLLIQGDNLDALKALLPFYRGQAAAQANFKQLVLDGGWTVEPDWEHLFSFESGRYPASAGNRYDGRWQFRKHYYPIIADLKAAGEEFECARAIDRSGGIRHWVRNPDNEFGFWLPTSRGRFFPDFVAELINGTMAVIEYKGGHLRADPYEIEKRQVGELWAARSGGRCRFRFVYLDDHGKTMVQQVDECLSV